jgi:mono/diheme cytochrome c family protein
MRVKEEPAVAVNVAQPRRRTRGFWVGLGVGIFGLLFLGVFVGGPFVLAKRGDLPLERLYGDVAVTIASRIGGGNQPNPVANDRRALMAGRDAYTGSCSVCHGATGDGRGVFGTSSYPNATDLRGRDAAEKTDAQTFWIIKNGLNFTGMPGFADQYSDQDIWSLVTYLGALRDPSRAPAADTGGPGPGPGVPGAPGGPPGQPQGRGGGPAFQLAVPEIAAPTADQLGRADAFSTDPVARGAALYFAQGCHTCHGALGDAPGNLGLPRGGGPEAVRAIREGRPGMPNYSPTLLTDAELGDLQAYLGSIGSNQRRGG